MDLTELIKLVDDFENRLAHDTEDRAKTAYRRLLFALAGEPEVGELADAVKAIANGSEYNTEAASILIRTIGWRWFPKNHDGKQLDRHVVKITERGLPGLCSFLNLPDKKNNFEKYELLEGAREWIDTQLAPLCTDYQSLDGLLSVQSKVQQNLSHGQLLAFGSIYKIPEVRDRVQGVFGGLKKVQQMRGSLDADVQFCENLIEEAHEFINSAPSFVTFEFLKPFLVTCTAILDNFVRSLRGRFTAAIEADWSGSILRKRYPLHLVDRDLRILVPFKNSGSGSAIDVRVNLVHESSELLVRDEKISLGEVSPGKFPLFVSVHVVEPCKLFSTLIEVEWGEVGSSERKNAIFEVQVHAQATDLDWDAFRYLDPYPVTPAEGDDFFGRQEQIESLVGRMLQTPMGPSYVTGQKRVGKTSLAKTAASYAAANDPKNKFSWHYILWGDIAHDTAKASLQALGESIESFVQGVLPKNFDFPASNFEGSLAPLNKLASLAENFDADRKFVVVIDEFDEMHQELYLHGELASTVFGNIRALTTKKNFCLLLVGGENMPFVMDRQNEKLNKFSRLDITYFDRTEEWDDYVRLVSAPSKNILNWHEDAVNEVYRLSNGNPYFTKIICSEVFARARKERDADVTVEEVRKTISTEISKFDDNLFAHLWKDGIYKEKDEREPVALARRRVLAAFARTLRLQQETTRSNIRSRLNGSDLTEPELNHVLDELVNRHVLSEADGTYRAVLPIFEDWLVDVGVMRLGSDALSESLAEQVVKAEDAARVQSIELVDLADKWPTYRGNKLGAEDIRAWLEQRTSIHEQRLLFKMLQSTRFFSETDIRQRVKNGQLTKLKIVEAFKRNSLADRRNDVVLTYVDGQGKSGQKYSAMYAEENYISTSAILPPLGFAEAYEKHLQTHGAPRAIVVVDDLVGTGGSMSENVKQFHDQNLEIFNRDQPFILIFSLFATKQGQETILKVLSELAYSNIDFQAGELLQESDSFFDGPQGIFQDSEERDKAKTLATDIGVWIYKNNPLGFGQQGLGVVFPDTVPNNSLPLLHSKSKKLDRPWRPLFERPVN